MKNKPTRVLYHHDGLDLFVVSRKLNDFFFCKRTGAVAERHPLF